MFERERESVTVCVGAHARVSVFLQDQYLLLYHHLHNIICKVYILYWISSKK